MRTRRPKAPIILSDVEDEQLKAITNSRSIPYRLVNPAHILLMAAQGTPNQNIAGKVSLKSQMVCTWRRRYLQQGRSGLRDELRPGRPRSISDGNVSVLVRKTFQSKPQHATHWTIRSIAKETEISRPTVLRVWRAFALEPHRQRHFKLFTDPFFVGKLQYIVGLYLNPPHKAVVLCVDEKSQIQALDRT